MQLFLFYLKDYFYSLEGILFTISLLLLGVATAKTPLHPLVGKKKLLAMRESLWYLYFAMVVYFLGLVTMALKPGLQFFQRLTPAIICLFPLAIMQLSSEVRSWNNEKLNNMA
ncbi:MAG: hypothetical protein WCG55_02020 [bacterium]